MTSGRNYGPIVTVRRRHTGGSDAPTEPIFTQIAQQVVKIRHVELRLPARAWKVGRYGCRIAKENVLFISNFQPDE